ncbi:BTB/POZ domain-containing protein 18 [Rhinatrema bivittatum]|uniref:BTB/POZ domain-containing protein 18 n=1 Tax=Rhinatrema bivittatum TaxID=194408 RepID=UPI001126C907|nr:BTB/POZ domain-containing protein 18 [Rhinatrema bivittatum]
MSAAPFPKLFYHSSRLMRTTFLQLHRQQKDNAFCDVILQAEGMQIPAHSCILSACSPFFTQRLSLMSPPAPQLVELSELRVSVLARLVHYVYTAELEVTRDEVEEVLAAARQLRILELEALHLEGGKLVKAEVGRRLNRDCFQSRGYPLLSDVGTSPVLIKRSYDSVASTRSGLYRDKAVAAAPPQASVGELEASATKRKRTSLPHKDLDRVKQKTAVDSSRAGLYREEATAAAPQAVIGDLKALAAKRKQASLPHKDLDCVKQKTTTGSCVYHLLSGDAMKEDVDGKSEGNPSLPMPGLCHAVGTVLENSPEIGATANSGGLQLGKVKKRLLNRAEELNPVIAETNECSLPAVMEGPGSVAGQQRMPVKDVAKKFGPQQKSGTDLTSLHHVEVAPLSDNASLSLPKPDVPSDHDSLGLPKPDVLSANASLSLPKPDVPSDHDSLGLPKPDVPSANASLGLPKPDVPSDHDSLGLPKPDVPSANASLGLPKPDVPSDHDSLGLPKPDVPSDHDSLAPPEVDDCAFALSKSGPSSDLPSFSSALSFPIHLTGFHHKASHSELAPTTHQICALNPCISRTQSTSSDTSGDESPVGRMKLRKRMNSACWEVIHERQPKEKPSQTGVCLPELVGEIDTATGKFLGGQLTRSDSRVQKEIIFAPGAQIISESLDKTDVEAAVPKEEGSPLEFALHIPAQAQQGEYSMTSMQEVKELDIVLSTSETSEFHCLTPDLEKHNMSGPASVVFSNGKEGKQSIPTNRKAVATTVFSNRQREETSVPSEEKKKQDGREGENQTQSFNAESAPSLARSPSHGSKSILAGNLHALPRQKKPTGAHASRRHQRAKQVPTASSGECSAGCSPCQKSKTAPRHCRSLRQVAVTRENEAQRSDGAAVECTQALNRMSIARGSDLLIQPERGWHCRSPKCAVSVELWKGSFVSPASSGSGSSADCPSSSLPVAKGSNQQLLASNSLPEITQTLLDSEEEIDVLGITGGEVPVVSCSIRPEPSSESDTDMIVVD